MALVLVMFPSLQQPALHEASRVNITICKGIQTFCITHLTFNVLNSFLIMYKHR